jgi:hypothetical protein
MNIYNIRGMKNYLNNFSGFNDDTICNVIKALGFDPIHNTQDDFRELSTQFVDCAEYGADIGISGFIYYKETVSFFKENRYDIIRQMEQIAAELGTDIISMVQGFGVFRDSDKPTPSEVGKALWDSSQGWPELYHLYNVFAWYTLEEISRTWYRYLEDNPAVKSAISA